MKIALILFGQPRFVDFKLASLSQKWALRSYDVSYFGHVWEEEISTSFEVSSWTGLRDIKMPSNALRHILKNYPKINIVSDKVEKFNQFFASDEDVSKIREFWENFTFESDFYLLGTKPATMFRNTLSQLYSVHRALELFELSNKENDFDIVILTRYDAVVLGLPNLSRLNQNSIYIEKTNREFADVLIIGGQKEILNTDAFPAIVELSENINIPSAELYKQSAYLSKSSAEQIQEIGINLFMLRGKSIYYLVNSLLIIPLKQKVRLRSRLSELFRKKNL